MLTMFHKLYMKQTHAHKESVDGSATFLSFLY